MNGSTYLKGFELIGSIIEMLNGNSKSALSKESALQAMSLLPTLKTYLPEDSNVSFYLERIIPAFQALKEFDQPILEESTKGAMVGAFLQLQEGLSIFLIDYFEEQEKVEVTSQNIPLLRSIVSLAFLGEEID